MDSAGNAYVTGQFGDGELMSGLGVAVAKLSPAGVPLYEYVFGANSPGFSTDEGTGIAVDDSGNVYVVGITGGLGTPFPTTRGAIQELFAGGLSDAFVVKMDPHGNFIYSTLLGAPARTSFTPPSSAATDWMRVMRSRLMRKEMPT